MCFSEFVGYTCGHSSPEVLRPCPMTTQFYTNPLCTQHARRPILAPEMCPACQRVIHGRAVLITEWEHRWMHERGACGSVFLFQVVGIWNNFFLPLIMLADQKLYPITLGLNNWRAQVDRLPEFYQLTTGGVLVSVIPLVIAIIVLQRFWRGGLTEGSVKG